MASLSKDKKGNVTIQFVGGDKKRRSIRLGKVSQKVANEVKLKVENLNAILVAKLPMDADTARWVAAIGDDLHAKLSAVGLLPPRQSSELGEFMDSYIERRKADAKGATITNYTTIRNDLVNYYGTKTDLRAVTVKVADDLRLHYLTRKPKLAAATVARRLKTVRMFFEHARKMKLIPTNPFQEVKAPSALPEERRYYISASDAEKLIAVANPTWRIIVALARFAGLRSPSEVLSLKWEHISFETGRMTVPSPKTEHHPGGACRICPIFKALRPTWSRRSN